MSRVSKGILKKFGVLLLLVLVLTSQSAAQIYAEGEDTWEEESIGEYSEEYSEESTDEYSEEGTDEYSEEGTDEYSEENTEEEYSEEAETEEEYSEEDYTEDEYSEEYYSEEGYSEEGDGTEGEDSEDGEKSESGNLITPSGGGTVASSEGQPIITANGALVYCRNTGEIVFAKNIDTRYSPYSTTNLLTALLAAQRLSMDQTVTISKEAAAQEGDSMDLMEGEVVTVEQLLYGTLILSGNDAAYALGEAVSGNIDDFVQLMNDTVKSIGCKNTQFASPSGSINDVKTHYTTAKDMLEIAKVVFSNSVVKAMAGTKEYEMPATEKSPERFMVNQSELINMPGYVAGMTGWWDNPDKATLVMNYEMDGLEFLVVVLDDNSRGRTEDCEKMIEYANQMIDGIRVVKKGEKVGKVRVRHGEITTIDAYTADESTVYLPKQGSVELITTEAVISTDVEAPVKRGDPVGKYKIYIAGELADEVDLLAGETVDVGWFPSYVGISNRNTLIIVGVIGVILLLLLMRSINRIRSHAKNKRAHRQRVRELAEEEARKEMGYPSFNKRSSSKKSRR